MLNVGKDKLLTAYKTVLASKYSPEALVYRINYGFTDMETPMAVLVVEMIDAMASGVMYTQGLDNPATDILEVHSVFGLGELLFRERSHLTVLWSTRRKNLKSPAKGRP